MTRNLLVQIGLAMSIALTAGTLQAQQDELLAELYGRGVHAYFEGELNAAHKFFSDAIEQKTQDPRCYYFRGATYTRLGRSDQATKDFQEGGRLEARDVQKIYPVNRSLQRVQGKVRLTLEIHRKQGRLELRRYEEKRKRVRYETLKAAEKDVLRDPKRQAPANLPKVPDDARLDPNNPFSGEEAGTLGGGTAQATKQNPAGQSSVATTRRRPKLPTETTTTTRPAAAQPAAQPAGANPFGGAPAAPAAAKPAAANPFGGAPATPPAAAQPAAANPFGGAPAAPPAAAPPAAANPFGGAPAEPAQPAPANPVGDAPAAQPAKPAAEPAKPAAEPAQPAPAQPAPAQPAPAQPAPAQPEPAQPAPGKPAANPFGAAPADDRGNAVEAAAEPAQKKGGAFGALFRATVKSIPGADAARKAIQGSDEAVEKFAPAGEPAAKPPANPFGADPAAKPAPAKPAAEPAKPAAEPAKPAAEPAKPAANPFGAP